MSRDHPDYVKVLGKGGYQNLATRNFHIFSEGGLNKLGICGSNDSTTGPDCNVNLNCQKRVMPKKDAATRAVTAVRRSVQQLAEQVGQQRES